MFLASCVCICVYMGACVQPYPALTIALQAALLNTGGVVIPQVYVPLNASDCMCDALGHLAEQATHPGVEPECSTNDLCNGVLCELNIIGAVYYLEIIVLPCQNAVSLLVEDSSRRVLHMSVFNQTATRPIPIGFLTLQTQVILVPHNYSMEVQVRCNLCNRQTGIRVSLVLGPCVELELHCNVVVIA